MTARVRAFPEAELDGRRRALLAAIDDAVAAEPTWERTGRQRYLHLDDHVFAPDEPMPFWGLVLLLLGAGLLAPVALATVDLVRRDDGTIPWAGLAIMTAVVLVGGWSIRAGCRELRYVLAQRRAPRFGVVVGSDGLLVRMRPARVLHLDEPAGMQWIPWAAVAAVEVERYRSNMGGPGGALRTVEHTLLSLRAPSDAGTTAFPVRVDFDHGGRPLHAAIQTAHARSSQTAAG